jgi:hypothetical protein
MKGGEVVRKIVNTNRSLQRTHTSTQPPPLPKLKEKKTKRKKKRGHGWSRTPKRRKFTSFRNCEGETKRPPTSTLTPTPKPKHKPNSKVKKKHDHGLIRSQVSNPPRGCEVETRYEFFRQLIPINSPRPATMKSIRLSESLGARIFDLLISMINNGDFDHESGPSRCSNRQCPYVTGDYHGHIRLLMQRVHEVCRNK